MKLNMIPRPQLPLRKMIVLLFPPPEKEKTVIKIPTRQIQNQGVTKIGDISSAKSPQVKERTSCSPYIMNRWRTRKVGRKNQVWTRHAEGEALTRPKFQAINRPFAWFR